jgi:DNA-directed RNA polymerase specialized sigma24 family protein
MGLSYPQIAEQLGMTESAVRGLVARGLAALSSVIDEEGEES